MTDVRVTSWIELQEVLFADSWQERISRHRSPYVFRGVSLAERGLQTSLQKCRLEPQERHLLTSFRKYALRSAVRGDSEWNWMSLAKHHGLPTRLLDWSYSPFVALHFATQDLRAFDRDGAVWAVDYRRTNELLPGPLRDAITSEDVGIFTTELVSGVAASLEEFDALGDHDFVLFFEPPSLDDRIVNQFALFSLPSSPRLALESLLRERAGAYRRIIIPADLKWEIRDKLDQANVTERVLFPGLDGLSMWLRRYFTAR